MLLDLEDGDAVFRQLHRAADAAVRDQLLAEHFAVQRDIRTQRQAAGTPLELLDHAALHVELACQCVDARCAGFQLLLQTVLLVIEALDGLLVAQLHVDLGTHVLEAAAGLGADPFQLDDVVAELGLHRLADLALLHREQLVGKGLHIGVAAGPAQVTAAGGGSRIAGMLAGQRREVTTVPDLLVHLLRQRRTLGVLRRVFHGEQDVARLARLRLHITRLVLLVARAQFVLGHHHGVGDVGQRQLGISQSHRLGDGEVFLVGLVPGLDGGRLHLGAAGELLRIEQQVAHLALFIEQRQQAARLGGRQEVGHADHAQRLVRQQAGLQIAQVGRLADAGIGQAQPRLQHIEHAIDLEGLFLAEGAGRLGVGDAEADLAGMLHGGQLAHLHVQQVLLQFGAQGVIQFAAIGLIQLRQLALPEVHGFGGRHLLAIDLDRITALAEGQVDHGIGTPGGKHDDQRADDQVPDPAAVFAALALTLEHVPDVLKHYLSAVLSRVFKGTGPLRGAGCRKGAKVYCQRPGFAMVRVGVAGRMAASPARRAPDAVQPD